MAVALCGRQLAAVFPAGGVARRGGGRADATPPPSRSTTCCHRARAWPSARSVCASAAGGRAGGAEIPLVMRLLKAHFKANALRAPQDLDPQVLTFDHLWAHCWWRWRCWCWCHSWELDPAGWPFRAAQRRGGGVGGLAVPPGCARAATWQRPPSAAPWCCWRPERGRIRSPPGGPLLQRASSSNRAPPTHRGDRRQGRHAALLNGNLQFHSRDEYRYHEALVHPRRWRRTVPKRDAGAGRW